MARALFGADPADSGTVRLAGRQVSFRHPSEAVRAGLGLVPEDRKEQGLVLGMSVAHNTTLAGLDRLSTFGWLRAGQENGVVNDLVHRLGVVTPDTVRAVRLLSGGNQQKVVIARWLATEAEVLIFDEPTRGVDVGAKVEIYRLINALAEQGRGIILISSELPEVIGMSDRILVMREGRIVGERPGRRSTEEEVLSLAFGAEATA